MAKTHDKNETTLSSSYVRLSVRPSISRPLYGEQTRTMKEKAKGQGRQKGKRKLAYWRNHSVYGQSAPQFQADCYCGLPHDEVVVPQISTYSYLR